jgi:hypothetical protein
MGAATDGRPASAGGVVSTTAAVTVCTTERGVDNLARGGEEAWRGGGEDVRWRPHSRCERGVRTVDEADEGEGDEGGGGAVTGVTGGPPGVVCAGACDGDFEAPQVE